MKRRFLSAMRILSLILSALLLCSACTLSSQDNTSKSSVNAEAADQEIVAPASLGGESQAAAAEAVVADLYKQHDARKSPFFQTKNRGLVDKYFTKQLGDLIWKDAVSSSGEIGTIDADPLYYAQDIEIKNLKIWPAEVKGNRASVKVTFSNYNEKKSFVFSLLLINGSWKISNIAYGDKEDLLSWLRSASAPSTGDEVGDFRGRYTVGDTSCTVEFKNKGYAVKWAKGSGIEYFSFMDGTTFASSTVESEANKFVFDDGNYNSGTFYRADGKTFPVKRAK